MANKPLPKGARARAKNKVLKDKEARRTENGGFKRRDYGKLKKEYFEGDFKTLQDFKRAKGIQESITAPFVGWKDEKILYNSSKDREIIRMSKGNIVQTVEEIKQKQINLYNFMLEKAAAFYEDPNFVVTNAEDARRLAETSMQGIRKLSGMEDGGGPKSLTQINITGKTNLDKLLETASHDEIIEYIAEVKRARVGVVRADASSASTQEVEEGEVI